MDKVGRRGDEDEELAGDNAEAQKSSHVPSEEGNNDSLRAALQIPPPTQYLSYLLTVQNPAYTQSMMLQMNPQSYTRNAIMPWLGRGGSAAATPHPSIQLSRPQLLEAQSMLMQGAAGLPMAFPDPRNRQQFASGTQMAAAATSTNAGIVPLPPSQILPPSSSTAQPHSSLGASTLEPQAPSLSSSISIQQNANITPWGVGGAQTGGASQNPYLLSPYRLIQAQRLPFTRGLPPVLPVVPTTPALPKEETQLLEGSSADGGIAATRKEPDEPHTPSTGGSIATTKKIATEVTQDHQQPPPLPSILPSRLVAQYYDFTQDSDIDEQPEGSGEHESFPMKLHRILSEEECADCIAWLPHGRSWKVVDQVKFEEKVIPLFFRHAKFASFMRQVNGWGFKRLPAGRDRRSYYHEMFLRGYPNLCSKMRRPLKKVKSTSDRRSHPNFNDSKTFKPLPPSRGKDEEGDDENANSSSKHEEL